MSEIEKCPACDREMTYITDVPSTPRLEGGMITVPVESHAWRCPDHRLWRIYITGAAKPFRQLEPGWWMERRHANGYAARVSQAQDGWFSASATGPDRLADFAHRTQDLAFAIEAADRDVPEHDCQCEGWQILKGKSA